MADYNKILIWPNTSAINDINIPQFPAYKKVTNANLPPLPSPGGGELQSNALIGADIAIGDVYMEDINAVPSSTTFVAKVVNFFPATGQVIFEPGVDPVDGSGSFYRNNGGSLTGATYLKGYKFRPGTPGNNSSPVDLGVVLPNKETTALLDYTVEKYEDVRVQLIKPNLTSAPPFTPLDCENFLILGEDGD